MSKGQTRYLTYLGSRAKVVTEALGGDTRRVTTTWIDDADERNGGYPAGTVTIRTMRGDGRTPDFELLSEEVILPTDEGK